MYEREGGAPRRVSLFMAAAARGPPEAGAGVAAARHLQLLVDHSPDSAFPMMGVSAAFLAQFIRQHPELAGGSIMAAMSTAESAQPGVPAFTTTDVCYNIVKPETKGSGFSYAELLKSKARRRVVSHVS